MEKKKPVILTLIRHYLPGYKWGGPVRSIANLVSHLGDEFDFKIITMDRDFGDDKPYPNIVINAWNTVGKCSVYYVSHSMFSLNRLVKLIASTPHDILYLNSLFDPMYTLWPLLNRHMGRIKKGVVILAPRGELSQGALALKHLKKNSFLTLAKASGFYRDILWQASSEYEKDDIVQTFEKHLFDVFIVGNIAQNIFIASDLSSQYIDNAEVIECFAKGCPIRLIFVSRISPKKNLDFALRVLGQVTVPVQFNIYGPKEDKVYWQSCEALINDLPNHICATYHGGVEHSKIASIMAQHDLFFFPTRGENFGHVITEAFSVGIPVLISDTTAWRNLEQVGVGWDLPLTSELPFAERIEYCAGLDSQSYSALRKRVLSYAHKYLIDAQIIVDNRNLFNIVSSTKSSIDWI